MNLIEFSFFSSTVTPLENERVSERTGRGAKVDGTEHESGIPCSIPENILYFFLDALQEESEGTEMVVRER